MKRIVLKKHRIQRLEELYDLAEKYASIDEGHILLNARRTLNYMSENSQDITSEFLGFMRKNKERWMTAKEIASELDMAIETVHGYISKYLNHIEKKPTEMQYKLK